jgi:O-antigen ligase
MEGGADRLDIWATGIDYIKHNPILGIGYLQFAELNGLTAHNSIVVCAAELGIPGFLLWVMFVFTSFRNSLRIAKTTETAPETAPEAPALSATSARLPAKPPKAPLRVPQNPAEFWASRTAQPTPATAPASTAVLAEPVPGAVSRENLHSAAVIMMIALTGFLTAGWFLSRALSTWLFMYCGMICALLRMSRDSGFDVPRDRLPWLVRWTAIIGFSLVLLVYLILRVRNIMPH